MKIEITCRVCKKPAIIEINDEDLKAYQAGGKVQNVFPYLSASEREMFITQYCGECWDEIFKDCEE